MLEIGKYLVIAAAVFIFAAFFLELALVSKLRNSTTAAERASRVRVSVGAQEVGDEPRSPISPVSPYPGPAATSGRAHGGMAWYATAFVVLALAMVTFYLVVRAIETGHAAEVTVSAALIRRYKERLERHCAELAAFCTAREMTHALVRSDADIQDLLLDQLRKRGMLR